LNLEFQFLKWSSYGNRSRNAADGESIAEGTITKWLKQVGDRVERDEPLFEISTDKVDAEFRRPLPAP